jgi:molybdenum cofactor cytidylyltransferase
MNSLAAVILAAGAATRFGSAKQLADIEGKVMLQYLVDCCGSLNSVDLYLLLGANIEEIQSRIKIDKTNIINNTEWQEGIGSSIRLATLELQNNYDGILFLAGDQPFVSNGQLDQLINKWRESPEKICAAKYLDTVGIPAIFPRNTYAKLILLEGDVGAKKLLSQSAENIQLMEIPEAAVDIDRPEDLDRTGTI